MSHKQEPILEVDTVFARQGASDWKVDMFSCYQCGKCSNGCPVTFVMDYLPHQLIRMLQIGMTQEVLQSKTIWLCASCETCNTRCPNEIEISKLMDELKYEVLAREMTPSEEAVSMFHKVFTDHIKMFGRVNETILMGVYQMRSTLSMKKIIKIDFSDVYKNIELGLRMLKRGRLSLFPRWKGRKEVRGLFKEG